MKTLSVTKGLLTHPWLSRLVTAWPLLNWQVLCRGFYIWQEHQNSMLQCANRSSVLTIALPDSLTLPVQSIPSLEEKQLLSDLANKRINLITHRMRTSSKRCTLPIENHFLLTFAQCTCRHKTVRSLGPTVRPSESIRGHLPIKNTFD